MKKQIFIFILLAFLVVSGKSQWTHHRTLSYEFVATGPGMWPQICTFDGVGYASMDWGLYGTTCAPSSGGPAQRFMNVLKIDEENDSIYQVDYMNDYGISGRFMISEKKLGKVFRFGNWQGYPLFSFLDTLGNYSDIGIHSQGFTRCFSAFAENHYYSIYFRDDGNTYHFTSKINGVYTPIDTFYSNNPYSENLIFAPQKIDFPAPDKGYMSVIDNGEHKIMQCSPDLLSWNAVYEAGSSMIADFVFDDIKTGYAIVRPGIIIRTPNGGISWDTVYNNSAQILNRLDVVNNNIVFACGNGGLILRTLDGGALWAQDTFPFTQNLNQIIMFDENNGYAMSNNIVFRLKTPDPIIPPPPIDTTVVIELQIGPNPNTGELKISAPTVIKTIEILDLGGKVLFTKSTNEKEITLNYYPNVAGFYLVRATFSNGQKRTEKIVFTR